MFVFLQRQIKLLQIMWRLKTNNAKCKVTVHKRLSIFSVPFSVIKCTGYRDGPKYEQN